MAWPEAWNYLTRRQKRDYLTWRLSLDPLGAKHIWPQTMGNIAIPNRKNVGVLQEGIDEARRGARDIIVSAINKAWRS